MYTFLFWTDIKSARDYFMGFTWLAGILELWLFIQSRVLEHTGATVRRLYLHRAYALRQTSSDLCTTLRGVSSIPLLTLSHLLRSVYTHAQPTHWLLLSLVVYGAKGMCNQGHMFCEYLRSSSWCVFLGVVLLPVHNTQLVTRVLFSLSLIHITPLEADYNSPTW